VTLISLDSNSVKTVSVAPIYSRNNEDVLGDITDTYDFESGSSGGNGDNGNGNGNGGENPLECVPDCTGDESCINGVCVPPGCVPETKAETCGSFVCSTQVNNCGEIISCGECGTREICNDGTGQCQQMTPIPGVVDSVWPAGIAVYFDSSNLPQDNTYSGYYARFLPPSQESECLLISDYLIPQPPQTKVMVRLDATQTSISAGDTLELWQTYKACMG
jgi:hypothetical protein